MEDELLTPRQQSVLAHLRANVGNPIVAGTAAHAVGTTRSTFTRSVEILINKGLITSRRHGGHRYIDMGAPVEPVRVMRDACPRCQTVNCTRHTASRLTNGQVRPGAPMRMW